MNFLQLLPGLPKELNRERNGLLNPLYPFSHESARRDEMAGQAGFEPATTGFGVRRSSQLELLTPVSPLQFNLSMQGVDTAERTKFLKGQFVRGPFLIFC